MKLGLLGGTFNPIHRGHVAMARAVRQQLGLDRLLLVPSGRPPHKRASEVSLATPEQRLAMVRLAIEGEPGLEASDVEVRRDGPSYTIDTIEAVRRENPGADLHFVIGADSLGELESWRDAKRLLDTVKFVVVNRPGFDLERGLAELGRELGEERAAGVRQRVVEMPPEAVSSTMIRERLRRGEPVDGLVPDLVRDYLREHALYCMTREKKT